MRERLAAHRASSSGSHPASRVRRLVVSGGVLEIELPGGGTARATGVELRPRRGGGFRVVAGPLEVAWRVGPLESRATFARAAADLAGDGTGRLLAVGGEVSIGALALENASLSGGIGGRRDELRLAGAVAGPDPGELALTVAPGGPALVRRAHLDLDSVPLAFLGPLVRPSALVDAARATGRITLARDDRGVSASAELAVGGVLVAHPLVSSQPVALDGSIAGRGSLRRLAGRWLLAVDDLRLERAALALDLRGLLEWRADPASSRPHGIPERGDLRLAVPETSCAGAFAAVPDGLRQRLAGLEVDGQVGGEVALSFDRTDPDATELAVAIDLDRCRVVAEPALSDPLRLAAPFDLRLADGGAIRVGDGPDHVQLARLPRHLVGAFVAAEDARFYRHAGFDAEQIERSLAIDLDSGRLLRGGSTISQQLVKNVYLSHERTAARKLQEAVITWRMEARLAKRVILERYLDLIELGEEVHGVGAAARYWFAVPAERLSIRQAAFLAALTPAPRTLSRQVRSGGGLSPELAERVDTVLGAMRVSRVIDRATYERARRQPLHLAPAGLSRSP